MYVIVFPNKAVEKKCDNFVKKLNKKDREKIKESILHLKKDPRPQGKIYKYLKLPVHIKPFIAEHRIRVGNYRVLYDVDDKIKKVVILRIRRKNEKTYK